MQKYFVKKYTLAAFVGIKRESSSWVLLVKRTIVSVNINIKTEEHASMVYLCQAALNQKAPGTMYLRLMRPK